MQYVAGQLAPPALVTHLLGLVGQDKFSLKFRYLC